MMVRKTFPHEGHGNVDMAHLRGSWLIRRRVPIENVLRAQIISHTCDCQVISIHGSCRALMNKTDTVYLDAAKTSSTISPHEPK
jgi:hypothetical protein